MVEELDYLNKIEKALTKAIEDDCREVWYTYEGPEDEIIEDYVILEKIHPIFEPVFETLKEFREKAIRKEILCLTKKVS